MISFFNINSFKIIHCFFKSLFYVFIKYSLSFLLEKNLSLMLMLTFCKIDYLTAPMLNFIASADYYYLS